MRGTITKICILSLFFYLRERKDRTKVERGEYTDEIRGGRVWDQEINFRRQRGGKKRKVKKKKNHLKFEDKKKKLKFEKKKNHA